MQKVSMLLSTVAAVVMMNGCGGGVYYEDDPYDNGLTTLFLVDEAGYSYAGIPYICDSMRNWSQTRNDGSFDFLVPESCTFDFTGLNGIYGDSLDDIVRITDDLNRGKGDIPYDCDSFVGTSSTYGDGSFEYAEDDSCTFYL